ncbi:MAG: hypothetical protein ACRC2J_19205 [Microcoleaceae cyanobacterium]
MTFQPVKSTPNILPLASKKSQLSKSAQANLANQGQAKPLTGRSPRQKTHPGLVVQRTIISVAKVSSIFSFMIVSSTLAVYGGTIHGQMKWTEKYQRLEKLRRNEQQLSIANELLKNQIAQQAESADTGLVSQNNVKRIFLEPAPSRPAPVISPVPDLLPASPAPKNINRPIGY